MTPNRDCRAAASVLAAEFKIEWRRPAAFVSAALFSLVVLSTQALVLPDVAVARTDLACAVFFISAFFAALLAEHSRIAKEQKNAVPCLLALSSSSTFSVYLGKVSMSFILVCLIEAGLFPFLIVFYNLPLEKSLGGVVGMSLLANFALACLMTLLGATASSWKGMRGALGLPLAILPLALPVLATVSIGSSRALSGLPFIPYVKLLLAADLSFWTVGVLSYGKLLGRQ